MLAVIFKVLATLVAATVFTIFLIFAYLYTLYGLSFVLHTLGFTDIAAHFRAYSETKLNSILNFFSKGTK